MCTTVVRELPSDLSGEVRYKVLRKTGTKVALYSPCWNRLFDYVGMGKELRRTIYCDNKSQWVHVFRTRAQARCYLKYMKARCPSWDSEEGLSSDFAVVKVQCFGPGIEGRQECVKLDSWVPQLAPTGGLDVCYSDGEVVGSFTRWEWMCLDDLPCETWEKIILLKEIEV